MLEIFMYMVRYSTLLNLPPLRFHCVRGSWDRTQDYFGIDMQPDDLTTGLDLIEMFNDDIFAYSPSRLFHPSNTAAPEPPGGQLRAALFPPFLNPWFSLENLFRSQPLLLICAALATI